MDGLLKAFWPLNVNSGASGVVPTYRAGEFEDSIDLQIKSLLYMFQRCNIADAQAFISEATAGGVGVAGAGGLDKYRQQAKLARESTAQTQKPPVSGVRRGLDKKMSLSDLKNGRGFAKNSINGQGARVVSSAGGVIKARAPLLESSTEEETPGSMDKEKLDILYSKTEFDKLMKSDEHRVLIDWKKNKFRSMCLLSGKPSTGELPSFPVKNYSFTVLPATSSEITYITILCDSNLYMEHYVSKEKRRTLAKEALDLVKSNSGNRATASFTKSDRAQVILTYLRRLSVEVQVERLYKSLYRERIKSEGKTKDPLSIPETSVPKKLTIAPSVKAAAAATPTTPQKPLSVSSNPPTFLVSPKTPKFYMKPKADTSIPFSHRSGNTQKSPQQQQHPVSTLPFVSPSQQVQTTKPRITSNHAHENTISPDRSRSNSPIRAPSRAQDSSPLLRKKGSAITLSKPGPVLASPTRSISVSTPSKPRPTLGSPASSGRKASNASPTASAASSRAMSRVSNSTSSSAAASNEQIRAEVMAQTRKAVQARLERERLLIESESL